jgi:PAS domain S-box-containing protein
MTEEAAGRAPDLAGLFVRLGQALTSSLDLHGLLEFIVDEALALLDAEVAILRLLDPAGEHLQLEVARGVPDEAVRQVRFRPGEGLAGHLLVDGRPVHGLNLQQDPRITQRKLARQQNWCSFVGVALHLHSQPIGAWFLVRHRRQAFGDEQVALLAALADYASLAIEHDSLFRTIIRGKHESEAVIQASANGILVVDGRGHVVDMNPALERLLGWTLRQARGRPCCDIVGCGQGPAGQAAADSICPLAAGSRGLDRTFLQYDIQARDGRRVPVEASYGLSRDEEGKLARIIMIFRDISRQEELRRLQAQIVANVSHELRTPLALIKGYATTLLSPEVTLDEEITRRFLGNVSVAADRLGRMIDDLLCASRLEMQQLPLQMQHFDLGRRIEQIVAWYQPHARNCHLVIDPGEKELTVWADPDRVEQVLANLLSNAIKYSPAGSTVTVQARRLGDPPRVVVHVADEGLGIAPEHLPRIFDRFYLTETSKRGVGLGLYICRELVKVMGGEIWVVSEVGRGSTFSFTLPVDADTPAAVASQPV